MKRVGAVSLFGVVCLSSTAFAHIQLTAPMARLQDPTGTNQKNGHCGSPGYVRANNPTKTTKYAPGSTITVTWMETINHPGHFRIAFQPNGEVFSLPPNGTATGNFQTDLETQEGMTDGTTGTMILADMIPDGTLTKQITLPNMECANCTLQVIQVMTNNPPYTPTELMAANNDLYFNCADITLEAGAPPPPDPMTGDDAGVGNGDDGGTGAVGGPNEVTGGCSTSGSSTTALFGLALIAGLRRRRR